jgi:3-oxoacyl-[acyl-carrier-protein] synthase II
MATGVVITGVGMVTPLGRDPAEVLRRIEAGESAAAPPAGFSARPFACPVCAQVRDFQAQPYVAETKMIRLMNRDAQLAVAAAHLALRDAGLEVARDYLPEEIALFGATGLAGLPLSEVAPLIRASTDQDGHFDPIRFGQTGLRSISPLLSFKILANMPVCFISICENIQGPNSIYTPWEGQGAQAIAAGWRALQQGRARCAVVGGCDVKTHELAFLSLEQQGVFRSWTERKAGVVPGEGAVFLVLETEVGAAARGARVYARLAGVNFGSRPRNADPTPTYSNILKSLLQAGRPPCPQPDHQGVVGRVSSLGALSAAVSSSVTGEPPPLPLPLEAMVAAGEADEIARRGEMMALSSFDLAAPTTLHPKPHVGNLFAAAAAMQVGLGALLAGRGGGRVLANCFGHGSVQAAFLLEKP